MDQDNWPLLSYHFHQLVLHIQWNSLGTTMPRWQNYVIANYSCGARFLVPFCRMPSGTDWPAERITGVHFGMTFERWNSVTLLAQTGFPWYQNGVANSFRGPPNSIAEGCQSSESEEWRQHDGVSLRQGLVLWSS